MIRMTMRLNDPFHIQPLPFQKPKNTVRVFGCDFARDEIVFQYGIHNHAFLGGVVDDDVDPGFRDGVKEAMGGGVVWVGVGVVWFERWWWW
jgi:hypothetical protein